jgi:hypothetical protein
VTNIETLKAAGMDVDALPAQQQDALNQLDQSEVEALVTIREKLNVGAEVSGYAFGTSDIAGLPSVDPLEGNLPRLSDGILIW